MWVCGAAIGCTLPHLPHLFHMVDLAGGLVGFVTGGSPDDQRSLDDGMVDNGGTGCRTECRPESQRPARQGIGDRHDHPAGRRGGLSGRSIRGSWNAAVQKQMMCGGVAMAGEYTSAPAVFQALPHLVRRTCDEDGHPAVENVMADDVRDRAIGIEPLKVVPVRRLDRDRGQDRMRWWQPKAIAHRGLDVMVRSASTD